MSVLVDANILLYAKFSDFRQHVAARGWLDNALNNLDPVGIAWLSLIAFVRIGTNRRIIGQPLVTDAALEQVGEDWVMPLQWRRAAAQDQLLPRAPRCGL